MKTVQLTKARGQLAGAMPVSEGFQVMLISNGGTVIRMPVDEIKSRLELPDLPAAGRYHTLAGLLLALLRREAGDDRAVAL